MPNEEVEEIDVTQLEERLANVEKEISDQKKRLDGLEAREAAAKSELETIGNSVDVLADAIRKRG